MRCHAPRGKAGASRGGTNVGRFKRAAGVVTAVALVALGTAGCGSDEDSGDFSAHQAEAARGSSSSWSQPSRKRMMRRL